MRRIGIFLKVNIFGTYVVLSQRSSFAQTRTVHCLVTTFLVWIYVIVSPAIYNNFHLGLGPFCAYELAHMKSTNNRIGPARFTINSPLAVVYSSTEPRSCGAFHQLRLEGHKLMGRLF